jgi:nicotinate-nucleotide adenylyltransferase
MLNRGIFGGTFDPVHWGHLAIAQAALAANSLTEIIWLPQISPPHKSLTTSSQHRWEMVDLAIAPYPQFRLPAPRQHWQELLKTKARGQSAGQPDYAIDTFSLLQKLYPTSFWYWILGADSFLTLPRWKGRHQLIPACTWLVATRNLPQNLLGQPPEKSSALSQVAGELESQGIEIRWEMLPIKAINISSSAVRQACSTQQPLGDLVPLPVQEYIKSHNLYSN